MTIRITRFNDRTTNRQCRDKNAQTVLFSFINSIRSRNINELLRSKRMDFVSLLDILLDN